ncbi:MAG TPA: phenylalanine--tRNA ligase subunit alpha [Candidatus Polarisedimenticolaceae bacterium]|nr:phenylalanine--tRNA ligase subunit alpha [Candidatus Polarisedimenticolaceae bacterium]
MKDRLDGLEREFVSALSAAGSDVAAVEAVRVRFLGKKGELTALLKGLSGLAPDVRPAAGQQINAAKATFEDALARAAASAGQRARDLALAKERVDVSLPGRRPFRGALHPVTQTRRELESIFRTMGYTVEHGPEVEDDFHNFEALNLPPGHPARDATDTFYLPGGLLLRTHTSPVQVRTMETTRPPIRMICPGRVYRKDLDATHLPMFHQLEALVVDEGISMADLRGTCAAVWKMFFGDDVEVRLRPGYFPFVEPGCEFDISCRVCLGKGCRACKQSGWLELGGAGMVHPAVFEAVGIDPERYTGFAFGLGIDRIAMMRFGIDDLRLLVENDVRFLEQFPC